MSQVHYKFKSSKDYDSATFDGHSISVFDLKKEILIAKGLKGPDDLSLTHAETGEEYYDDAALIPRNTSVLVARVPAKPGRGGAQRYLEGSGPIPRGGGMTRNVFERPGQGGNQDAMASGTKLYKSTQNLVQDDGPPAPAVDMSNMTEDERMKFVFEQSASVWDKTQEGMASAQYRPLARFQSPTKGPTPDGKAGAPAGHTGPPSSGQFYRNSAETQHRPPPNTYVCHRCGKKGEHWIRFCPTNNDKSFEPIGIKKTTGIPRSFLKTVESDSLQSKKGVMVTQDGNLVVATTNDSEWRKFHEKSKGAFTSEEAYAIAPVPEDMKCSICLQLLKNAVQTPCCGTNFCDECIRNYLVRPPKGDDPFRCQHCHKNLVPDQLTPDVEARKRVERYVREWAKNRHLEVDGPMPINNTSRGGTPNSVEDRGSQRNSDAPGPDDVQIPTNLSVGPPDNDKVEAGQKRKLSTDNGASTNELMKQHDPALFMDPGFLAAQTQGLPSLMMPGFMPPYAPEFGMPGLGAPGAMGPGAMGPGAMGPGAMGPGAMGPDMWGMGRGIPGLPPMGPGFPTPRIGFGDRNGNAGPGPGSNFDGGANRGRGRGWQGNSGRGRGQDLHQDNRENRPNEAFNSTQGGPLALETAKPSPPVNESNRHYHDQDDESVQSRGRSVEPNRYDDDLDMSQVPTGPRSETRRRVVDEDDDIPKGPAAGNGEDYDRRSERSESPPTAPLADRIRFRSSSRSRSDKDDCGDRDRSRRHESRDRDRDHRDKHSSEKDRRRDGSRNRREEKERDHSKEHESSRSSRYDRDYDEHHSRRSDRRDDDRRDD
ncbi:E3 ubiquitin-protein ligase rbbp6, partial [Lunasporangiospora selenospora]